MCVGMCTERNQSTFRQNTTTDIQYWFIQVFLILILTLKITDSYTKIGQYKKDILT